MPGKMNSMKLVLLTTATTALHLSDMLVPPVQSVPILSAADLLRQIKSPEGVKEKSSEAVHETGVEG